MMELNVWHGGVSQSNSCNPHFSNLDKRHFVDPVSGHTFYSVEHGYHSLRGGHFCEWTYRRYPPTANCKIQGPPADLETADALLYRLMLESFRQNREVAIQLIETGDTQIVHHPATGYWAKRFPELLMDVRDILRNEIIDY